MNDKKIGSYEKLLNVLNLNLDSPFTEREEALENLADKLQILEDEGWLDRFLEMADLYDALESSCWYRDREENIREEESEYGYQAGYDAAVEDRQYKIEDELDEWMDKLKAFLKSDWIGLTKEAAIELRDWFRHYKLEI